MRRKKNWLEEAIMECYREMYRQATPPADFDELMANAELNERGQKIIPYDKYELEQEKLDEIVNTYIKKYKMKGVDEKRFHFQMYLGCSPKTKNTK